MAKPSLPPGDGPPVLFLIFNRPDLTRLTFDRIRAARPSKLFIAADGPRAEQPDDPRLCQEARSIVGTIDWDCELKTFYREENVGCRRAVSTAISWFFEHVDAGVILEDDCLPDPSFFTFCSEMLARFQDDERVMQVSGTTATGEWKSGAQSYHFSLYGGIWGWASWRRAWQHYDVTMKAWRDPDTRKRVRRIIADAAQFRARAKMFDLGVSGNIDTWDYQWSLARILNEGLTVVPSVNLVSNIGFRTDATHTRHESSPLSGRPTYSLSLPIRHCATVARDVEYDREYSRRHGHTSDGVPLHRRMLRQIWRLARRGKAVLLR
jgi:hypothetical protein